MLRSGCVLVWAQTSRSPVESMTIHTIGVQIPKNCLKISGCAVVYISNSRSNLKWMADHSLSN